jgi:hypothetical protein
VLITNDRHFPKEIKVVDFRSRIVHGSNGQDLVVFYFKFIHAILVLIMRMYYGKKSQAYVYKREILEGKN